MSLNVTQQNHSRVQDRFYCDPMMLNAAVQPGNNVMMMMMMSIPTKTS